MTCLIYELGALPKSFRWRGRDEFRHPGRYVKTQKFTNLAAVSEPREGNWSDDKLWDDTELWGKYTP